MSSGLYTHMHHCSIAYQLHYCDTRSTHGAEECHTPVMSYKDQAYISS